MVVHELVREQVVPRPIEETFAFFAQARNLESITPPWLHFEVLTPEPIAMRSGAAIEYRLRLHGIPMRWTAQIEEWEEAHAFVDRQIRGPYRLWHHRHEFEEHPGGTLVRDHVHYGLPAGPFGALAHRALVRRDVERIFDFRAAAVARRLAADDDGRPSPRGVTAAGADPPPLRSGTGDRRPDPTEGRGSRVTPARSAVSGLMALRIAYGAALVAAPELLARSWLGPAAATAPAQVPLRGLGMREVLLHAGGLLVALRGGDVRPWLAASIAGDVTDIATTVAGRSGLPRGAASATAAVAGASALISLAVGTIASREMAVAQPSRKHRQ